MVLTIMGNCKGQHSDITLANPNQIASQSSTENHHSGWQQVPIGGGGYVTGVYAHPQVADLVYMKTDNGGAYRWHPQAKRWQNIIDHFPRLPWNYYGVQSLALDPHNPELVYVALGKYADSGNGRLWKSSDRGNTWIESDLQVPIGGDTDKRWTGNRLAVSPHDGNLLLFGSGNQGLWRSQDGGIHWSQIKSFGASPHPDLGLIAVAFDPVDQKRVYLSAYGDGIYLSDDQGWTWSKMTGSPVHGTRIVVSGDRSVYVTSDLAPGVSKYVDGVWKDITPSGFEGQVFNALDVHPDQPNQVIVARGEVNEGEIFYSADGGITWQEITAHYQSIATIPWWPNYFFNDHTSAVIFDPHTPQRLWLSDWFGVWRTDNFPEKRPIWTSFPQGQEQIVTFSLVSPPKGASLLSGVADIEGFKHQDLNSYPQDRLGYQNPYSWKHRDRYWQDTYDLAYSVNRPFDLVRVGGKRDEEVHMVATSNDGGTTWQELSTFPDDKIPLQVAISANNPQQFVIVRSEGQPLQTSDRGNTWRQVSGLPDGMKGPWTWNHPLAADGVNPNQFYYFAGGTLYRSADGGITFVGVNNSLPSAEHYFLATVPQRENELWLSLDDQGLWVSKDGGSHFSQIEQVKYSRLLAWGKSRQNNPPNLLYLYGEIGDRQEGLFRSKDRGQTWQKLDDIPLYKQDFARTILVLEASQQEPNLVFIGTDGRGIYYRYFDDV